MITVLSFSKAEVVAMAQSGLMHIKSPDHWDICNDLRSGKDEETVARIHRKSPIQVYKIRKCKCPDV